MDRIDEGEAPSFTRFREYRLSRIVVGEGVSGGACACGGGFWGCFHWKLTTGNY